MVSEAHCTLGAKAPGDPKHPIVRAEEALPPGGESGAALVIKTTDAPRTASRLHFPPLGLRTEQDLYVRLIDSMSKQVSQPRDALAFSDPISW